MKHLRPLLLLSLFLSVGCASQPPLPVYPWRGSEVALKNMGDRSAKLKSAAGTATLTLIRPDGASVRVDSAFAMNLPDSLRIRAWKMNRAVADWTMRGDGVWVWQAESGDASPQAQQAGPWSAHHSEIWPLLFGVYQQSAGDEIIDSGAADLIVRRRVGEVTASIIIDKATLVVRECRILQADGTQIQCVKLERYALMGELFWPMEVTAQGEAGAFELRVDSVTLNEESAPSAFEPPARAKRLH